MLHQVDNIQNHRITANRSEEVRSLSKKVAQTHTYTHVYTRTRVGSYTEIAVSHQMYSIYTSLRHKYFLCMNLMSIPCHRPFWSEMYHRGIFRTLPNI